MKLSFLINYVYASTSEFIYLTIHLWSVNERAALKKFETSYDCQLLFILFYTILSLDCDDWLIMASCVCLLNYLKTMNSCHWIFSIMVLVDGDAISHGKFDSIVDPNDTSIEPTLIWNSLWKRDFEKKYLEYYSFYYNSIITNWRNTWHLLYMLVIIKFNYLVDVIIIKYYNELNFALFRMNFLL